MPKQLNLGEGVGGCPLGLSDSLTRSLPPSLTDLPGYSMEGLGRHLCH